MQDLKDAFRQLLRDLRGQKLRTALTLFGVTWGTVAVTLLLAFGGGLHQRMIKTTAGLGDRIAIASAGMTSIPFEGLGKGRTIRLTEDDIEAARRQTAGLRAISSEYATSLRIHYAAKTMAVDVSGVSPCFGDMRNLIPQPGGRFLNEVDLAQRRRVVFLGNKLATDVFGSEPAPGRVVQLGGSPFTVVGVLTEKQQDSNYSGPDAQKAFIPGSTFRALTGARTVDLFIVQAERSTEMKGVIERLREVFGRRLRFDPSDQEAVSAWDTTEQFAFFDTFFLSFNLFLGFVGALTLVVGGIGVSNIMHVAVEERTREFGIKMALGAREGTILRQLLLETLLVTAAGGLLGFAIAGGLCAVFPAFGLSEQVGNPRVSPLVALLTMALLGIIGLVAGYFPAREASRLDPVVAMKL